MGDGVLLDTSFFLRFLKTADPLFRNADDYYQYFMRNQQPLFISTVSIAEYCVQGQVDELPMKNLQVIPFNINHAIRSGKLAEIVFKEKNKLKLTERNLIPNDTKLFAQADSQAEVGYYLSSDEESLKIFKLLQKEAGLKFQFLNLKTPANEAFGELGLDFDLPF